MKNIATCVNRYRLRREQCQTDGMLRVRSDQDVLMVAGAMLYWAEGGKTSRNTIRFTNSDPHMIRFFMRFLRETLHVADDKIRVKIVCYDDLKSVKEIESFWMVTCGLSKHNFQSTIVNHHPVSSKKIKFRKSANGTCRLIICDVEKMQRLFGFIKQIAGIDDKNLWL